MREKERQTNRQTDTEKQRQRQGDHLSKEKINHLTHVKGNMHLHCRFNCVIITNRLCRGIIIWVNGSMLFFFFFRQNGVD